MTIPDEAVQAAYSAYVTFIEDGGSVPVIDAVREALTAAAPFLQGVSSPRAQALEEGDNLCSRLEGLASWLDGSQHSKWCGRKEVPIHGYSGEGKLVREAIAAIRALSSQPVADGPERGKFYHKHWDLSKLLEARNGGLVDHSGGEAWRYEYTSKDEHGKYDMLYRHNVNASVPARLPTSPGASE